MDIRTVLEYSPYDNKRKSPFNNNGNKEKDKDDFKSHFFVDYPDRIDYLKNKLIKVIDGESVNTVLFYGASGTGKTTFLNHFMEETRDQYNYHYINLIEKPTPMEYVECIREILLSEIYKALKNNENNIIRRLYERVVIEESLKLFDKKEDNDIIYNYLVANDIESEDAEDYLCEIGVDKDGKLISGINTNRGLLVLYLVLKLIKEENNVKPNRKNVFVFDNLDEIPTQYIYSHTYQLIQSAFSIVQGFFEKNSKYPFLSNCTFIMSYRSSNAQIVDRTQHEDRLRLSSVNIEFRNEYQVSYSRVINKRISYYINQNKTIEPLENERRIRELLNSESDYCTKVLRPLFNYDLRMFIHFFVLQLCEKNMNVIDYELLRLPDKDQRKGRPEQIGARGFMLFYALKSMMGDPSLRLITYIRHEFENESLCNIYRMAFTLLSNLGGWALQDDELVNAIKEENSFNDETPRISFLEFAKRIEKWYGKEMFKTVISGLMGYVAYNFEYPMVLVGSLIDDYFKDENNIQTTSGLAQYIENVYDNDETQLANVYVKINPLCVIYSWRVFINFEYYNLISNQWNNTMVRDNKYSPVPLFEITNEFVLKSCLNSVFSTVRYILNKADNHFCDNCFTSGKAKCSYKKGNQVMGRSENRSNYDTCIPEYNSFIDDGFCINKTMYATRVITSHLNYLEQYRAFMWRKSGLGPEKSHKIQSIVIEQMEKYLDLWDNRRIVENKRLFSKYRDNVMNAKQMLENLEYVSIEIEEDGVSNEAK